MKKITKIIAAATAVLITVGAAGCVKNSYPDFINPTEQVGPVAPSEKYVINVRSEGGMKLEGVKVAAMRNGQVIRRGISINGKIELGVALGEYELVVDETSLPAGYHMPTETYKTNASARDEVTIKIPSSLIPANSPVQASYALGTIMKDFTFTDCRGAKYTLSDLLSVKKAVVLNFWYSGCGPCRAEFPHVQRAYASRTDVEFLAICSTHLGDTNTVVENYKTENGLSFPMGVDTVGMNSAFGVANFPTTVIIDRYGLIAYKSAGTEPSTSFWTNLFNDFCSDNYTQKLSADGTDPENPDVVLEKPTYTMPSSEEIASVASGNRVSATYKAYDDEYSWPWLVSNDGYVYSSNTGKHNSYAMLLAEIPMKKDEVLAIEYNVSSEAGRDKLQVIIDGIPVSQTDGENGWSATNGWVSENIYVADRDKTINISFSYIKDAADPDDESVGDDVAKIRNIHILDSSAIKEPIDVLREAASGKADDGKYEHYVNVVYNHEDGFYHKDDENGALLYICINQITPWSDLHTGNQTEGNDYINSLYQITYNRYATKASENTAFNVTLGNTDLTETVTEFNTIYVYMDAPKYLIPVTKELRTWAEKFTERFERDRGTATHKDEWLEFCFYYDHYGEEHEGGERCAKYDDPTRGLTRNNCYFAYEKDDPALANSETYNKDTHRNKAEINFGLETPQNGTYYKFTAKDAGVYQIQSYMRNCSTADANPGVIVYDENGNYLSSENDVRDQDQFIKQAYTGYPEDDAKLPDTAYQGFNHYITLTAGQTVYLKLLNKMSATGYYDFEITYRGTSLDVLTIGTTGGGIWGGESGNDYVGINYALVDNYYYFADDNGNADLSKPIYIDMIFGSYLRSERTQYNFEPLKALIDDPDIFNNANIPYGTEMRNALKAYLGEATAEEKEGDTYYGMVRADDYIVEILNIYFDNNLYGGRGEGNGWLMFACYMEHYGE